MAEELGFPLVLRPSHVLGGRGMEIVRDVESFSRYIREAVHVSGKAPLLLDRYLSDASEVDVDAVCDGEDVWISGIMEHIEEAGVHSGDSACSCRRTHSPTRPSASCVARRKPSRKPSASKA
jgi:carbamoyl-phosphate synthase large subunit